MVIWGMGFGGAGAGAGGFEEGGGGGAGGRDEGGGEMGAVAMLLPPGVFRFEWLDGLPATCHTLREAVA